MSAAAFGTDWGGFVLSWQGDQITGLQLAPHEFPAASDAPQWVTRLGQQLSDPASRPAAAQGALPRLDWSGQTDFTQLVLTTLAEKVPSGSVVSYGELALMAGRPGAARAVGTALAQNRFALIIPCHRVVGSNKRLGGFQNSRRDGPWRKWHMLEEEGLVYGPEPSR